MSVPSEEDGGQGMLAAIRAGCTGDMAVITEPTGLEVVIAHAGAITFRLVVPGRAAHASRRTEGVSALDKLGYLVAALAADEERRNAAETDPLMTALGLPYPTIVGTNHGGDWASTVIDRIVAEGRYGVRLGQTAREAETELRAVIEAACAADPFLREHPATRRDHRWPLLIVPDRRPIMPSPWAWQVRSRPSRVAGLASSASHTAPTCGCSSTRGRRPR